MSEIVWLLGEKGLIAVIGLMFFLFCYKYSTGIFEWIEKQTLGTRSYIMEKFELLFIEVKEQHITYVLLLLSVGLGFITLAIMGVLGHWMLGAFLAGILSFIGFKIPKPIVNYLYKKRIKQYSGQMVDALTLLANGLRAGLSVPQAIGMIVDEMPPPVSQEFNLILQQNKIGVTLEECFEGLAKRVPTEDNDMFVTSVNILRETGGNLAETFDTIVSVIRERVRLQLKIEQLTASGMFQGLVIAAMPYAIGFLYFLSEPESMIRMFQHPVGLIIMFVAVCLDAVGLFIILKIVDIK
ncbi:MAG: type II secretion system F family protein [Bdellovibrio sp.]|nr:type II secretion system F family protein [Bdellovibrio sp.]